MVWLDESCRKRILSHLPKQDLINLRLVCHDFGVQVAPKLFASIKISFDSTTFTKASKIAELERIGHHVKKVSFNLPHSARTFLPPLIDPESGTELNFTYSPQVQETTPSSPKYGDTWTTDLLTRQYPPLFHAATNVHAFIRAFSCLINLKHLKIQCPDYDITNRYRRSIVDYALISLRIAVEQNELNALRSLTIAPMHPGGLMYLSPLIGFGASPKSASRWMRIRHLTIHVNMLPSSTTDDEPNHFMLLQTYLRNFQPNLETLDFRWIGGSGPLPVKCTTQPTLRIGRHPAFAPPTTPDDSPTSSPISGPRRLHFPKLEVVDIKNVAASAADISAFWTSHETIKELHWESVRLTTGTWDDVYHHAIEKFKKKPVSTTQPAEFADIPIMLAPSMSGQFPRAMTRTEPSGHHRRHRSHGRDAPRASPKCEPSKSKPLAATSSRLREGWHGCEQHLKKVLRGGFNWI